MNERQLLDLTCPPESGSLSLRVLIAFLLRDYSLDHWWLDLCRLLLQDHDSAPVVFLTEAAPSIRHLRGLQVAGEPIGD